MILGDLGASIGEEEPIQTGWLVVGGRVVCWPMLVEAAKSWLLKPVGARDLAGLATS